MFGCAPTSLLPPYATRWTPADGCQVCRLFRNPSPQSRLETLHVWFHVLLGCTYCAFETAWEAFWLVSKGPRPSILRSKSIFWSQSRIRFQLVRVWATNPLKPNKSRASLKLLPAPCCVICSAGIPGRRAIHPAASILEYNAAPTKMSA